MQGHPHPRGSRKGRSYANQRGCCATRLFFAARKIRTRSIPEKRGRLCSQKAPEKAKKPKQRPDGSPGPLQPNPLSRPQIRGISEAIRIQYLQVPLCLYQCKATPTPGAPENIRPRLAEQTNAGLSASIDRVPKIAQQFWSSCAAAALVCVAAAFSGAPGVGVALH